MPQKLARVALLIAGLFIGLFITEMALRVIKPPQLDVTRMPCIYKPDRQIGYRYIPNSSGWLHRNFEIDNLVKINSMGFHDEEYNPLQLSQAAPLAVVIGDSFTAGLEVELNQKWIEVAQRQLHREFPTLEMINLGLDGTGTDAHVALLKEQLDIIHPDWVILAFYRNDVKDLLHQREFRECFKGYVLSYQNETQREEFESLVDYSQGLESYSARLFNNSYLVRLIYFVNDQDNIWQSNYRKSANQNATDPIDINAVFQELIALSQQHQFRLLVIPMPAKDDLTDSLNQLQAHLSAPILAQLEIVDISADIQRLHEQENKRYSDLFWRDDGHFNIYGHRLFGIAVANAFEAYLKGEK